MPKHSHSHDSHHHAHDSFTQSLRRHARATMQDDPTIHVPRKTPVERRSERRTATAGLAVYKGVIR